jgi:hypothetical protein
MSQREQLDRDSDDSVDFSWVNKLLDMDSNDTEEAVPVSCSVVVERKAFSLRKG